MTNICVVDWGADPGGRSPP